MNKAITLLTALALSFLLCPVSAAQQDDVVLGKNRSEWLSILKNHKESKFRRGAIIALTVIGANRPGVMPGLVQALETDVDPEIRREVASTIGQFGVEGKGAVDALANRLQTDESAKVREASARALGKLAEFATIHVMGLGRALKDKSPEARSAAAEALISFGDKAKIVLPQLSAAAQDKNNDVFTRLYAVQILGKQAGDDDKIAAALVAILADKDTPPNLRQATASALGNLGPAASGAVTILAEISTDRSLDKELRRSAALALGRVGVKAAAAWPMVQGLLDDPDVGIRYQAVRLAGIIGKGKPDIGKVLVKAMTKEQNVEVLLALVQEAGELAVMEAVPELDRLVRTDLRQSIRQAAEASLKRIKGS